MRILATILMLIIATQFFSCERQPSDRINWVQDILNNYEDSLESYGIVALVDQGGTMDTASVGFSFEKKSISTKNRFCIGSCTKMYTAVLIMKLHEQGLLNVNDSIIQFLPHHNYIDSTITIKQLLNHTSGLTDFVKNDFINAPFFKPYADYSDNLILSRIDTVEFEKGTRYKYSNTNYFLLRKIIETVADRPYESAVQEYIITPLGLKNTFPYHSNKIKLLAHPIIDGQDLHEIPKLGSNIVSKGIGNIVSDIYDLNKFTRALFLDKTLLKPATLQLMSDFYSYKETKVGLGLYEETFSERKVWGHTGRQISYITYAFADIETGESFIVINNNANDHYIDKIFEELTEKK